MLIYGNTPKDIMKMMFRNKTKVLIVAGAVVLAVSLGTNKAVAEETVTPKEFVGAVAQVPSKVATHISNEWAETKEYQAKSWAEAKAQWSALITKLSSK